MTSLALVVVSRASHIKNSSLMFPSWTYLTNARSWEQELRPTSVDSSTWKAKSPNFHFLISTTTWWRTSPAMSEIRRWIVESDRETWAILAAAASPRISLVTFSIHGLLRVSAIVWAFFVLLFEKQWCMKPPKSLMTAAYEHHCHPFFFLSNLQHAFEKIQLVSQRGLGA